MTLLDVFDQCFPTPVFSTCHICGNEHPVSELRPTLVTELWLRSGCEGNPPVGLDLNLYCPDCLEKLGKQG